MIRGIQRAILATAICAFAFVPATLAAQTTTPVPKPSPFPTGTQPATAKPAGPTTPGTQTTQPPSPQDGATVDPRLAGIAIYPGAELLTSFDTGRGQWVFTLGTDMPYSDIVAYYKNQTRTSGTEIFKTPLIHQFDLGQFRAETMTYRPGIVVKDYSTDGQGYLHVTGTTEKRFRTVIQIVPAR